MGIYRSLALSNHPFARGARGAYRRVMRFSVPSPRWVFRPLLGIILGVRSAYYFVMRVFICEPLFKACCARYGKDVHTGPHLHWSARYGEHTVDPMGLITLTSRTGGRR